MSLPSFGIRSHAAAAWGVVVALGLAAGLLALYATKHGVGITYDSTVYVDAARHIAAGYGFTFNSGTQDAVPVTHYPPLYSVLLAGLITFSKWIHVEFDASRALGVMLFAANVATVAWMMLRWRRSSLLPAVLTAGLCALSFDLLRIHCTAWSEGLFLLFTLWTLWALAHACLPDAGWRPLVLAAAGTGLCMMTRFAGLSVLMTGGACLLAWGGATFRVRLIRAAVYGAIAVLPSTAWMIRNVHVAGTATNRRLEFHPIGAEVWVEAARTLARWWVPSVGHTSPNVPRASISVPAAILVMIGFSVLATYLWRSRTRATHEPATVDRVGPLDAAFTVFIIVYLAFVIFSIMFVDQVTPLDWRILSPVFVCGLMMQVAAVWTWLATQSKPARQTALRLGYISALALVLVLYGMKTLPWAQASSRGEDKGYNSSAWRKSGLIRWARRLPKRAVIYTNGSAALRYHAGRGSYILPRDRDIPPSTDAAGAPVPNGMATGPNWRQQTKRGVMASAALEKMAKHLGRNGYVIFFKVPPESARDEKHVVRALKLKLIRGGKDGNAYRMPTKAELAAARPPKPARKRPKPATTTTAPATMPTNG